MQLLPKSYMFISQFFYVLLAFEKKKNHVKHAGGSTSDAAMFPHKQFVYIEKETYYLSECNP